MHSIGPQHAVLTAGTITNNLSRGAEDPQIRPEELALRHAHTQHVAQQQQGTGWAARSWQNFNKGMLVTGLPWAIGVVFAPEIIGAIAEHMGHAAPSALTKAFAAGAITAVGVAGSAWAGKIPMTLPKDLKGLIDGSIRNSAYMITAGTQAAMSAIIDHQRIDRAGWGATGIRAAGGTMLGCTLSFYLGDQLAKGAAIILKGSPSVDLEQNQMAEGVQGETEPTGAQSTKSSAIANATRFTVNALSIGGGMWLLYKADPDATPLQTVKGVAALDALWIGGHLAADAATLLLRKAV